MDKKKAYIDIYYLIYGKEKKYLNHFEKMQELLMILDKLGNTSFNNGKKEVINALHKLLN